MARLKKNAIFERMEKNEFIVEQRSEKMFNLTITDEAMFGARVVASVHSSGRLTGYLAVRQLLLYIDGAVLATWTVSRGKKNTSDNR